MIVADLLARLRQRAPAPVAARPVTFPTIAVCTYCGRETVVMRMPRRRDFCSHRCARRGITRIVHGMRVRYEQAQKQARAEAAKKRKAVAQPMKVAA